MNWLLNLIPMLVDAGIRIGNAISRRRDGLEAQRRADERDGVDLSHDMVYLDNELRARLEKKDGN